MKPRNNMIPFKEKKKEEEKKHMHPERLPSFVMFNSFPHSFSTILLTSQSLFLPSFSYPGIQILPILSP